MSPFRTQKLYPRGRTNAEFHSKFEVTLRVIITSKSRIYQSLDGNVYSRIWTFILSCGKGVIRIVETLPTLALWSWNNKEAVFSFFCFSSTDFSRSQASGHAGAKKTSQAEHERGHWLHHWVMREIHTRTQHTIAKTISIKRSGCLIM